MGLRENILSHPVSQLELRPVIAVKPTDSVRQALQQMRDKRLGCVVIVDQDNRPLGKFTERLLIRLLIKDPAALDEPVGDHMAHAWGSVKSGDSIARVIECMEEKKLRFVIVVDDQGRPIGLTGQKGVMEYLVEHFPRQIKVQETGSKLYMDDREGA